MDGLLSLVYSYAVFLQFLLPIAIFGLFKCGAKGKPASEDGKQNKTPGGPAGSAGDKEDAKDTQIVLTKNQPKNERQGQSMLPTNPSKEVPDNIPLAPPPKDPFDDTLRNVNSLDPDLVNSVKKTKA